MIDVLYLAWNRKKYTMQTFELLLRNTDWALVNRLVVVDDGSKDGTRQWLTARLEQDMPVEHELWLTSLKSPPAVMNLYLASAEVEMFAKIDNDIAVPPRWLNDAAQVMADSPELELLGLATGWTGVKDGPLGWEPSSHIGGVGLMRVSAFRKHGPIGAAGRFGFTEWQHQHQPVRGWITPDVAAVQLDLIPDPPYRQRANRYKHVGWQRAWPPYEDRSLYEWVLV